MLSISAAIDWASGSPEATTKAEREDWSPTGPSKGTRVVAVPHAVLTANCGNDSSDAILSLAVFRDDMLGIAVVADARIDNADEICDALGLRVGTSCAELLARGYARWGSALPAKLAGDFSFVLWDWRQRKLVAARDPFGIRGLVYRIGTDRIVFATEVEQILDVNDSSRALDEETILEYLTWDYRDQARTFFMGVSRVPAGHTLEGSVPRLRLSRYWSPPKREVRLATTADYHQQFRELFFRSVADRLRGDGLTLMQLSGGLDSSSIVCVADVLQREGHTRGPLKTVTARYRGLACDEESLVSAVRRRIAIPCELWDGTQAVWLDLDQPSVAWPGGRAVHTGGTRGDLEIARRDGATAILSGLGGDQIGSSTGVLEDLAADHQWVRVVTESLLVWRGSARKRIGRLLAALSCAGPRWIFEAHRALRATSSRRVPPWLSSRFKELVRARQRRSDSHSDSFLSHIQRRRWIELNRPTLGWSIERQRTCAASEGVEMRYPFLDVRLANFVLGIPSEHWEVGDYPVRIQRSVLRDLLPAEILARREKTTFESAIKKRVLMGLDRIRALLHAPNWASHGYVEQHGAQALLATCQNETAASWTDYDRLWRIAVLEAWLKVGFR